MTKLQPRRNLWAVLDDGGLIHTAAVTRFFDDEDDRVTVLHVATGCHPAPTQKQNTSEQSWTGVALPRTEIHDPVTGSRVAIGAQLRFTIIKWNVREAPTCLGCVAHEGDFK